MTCGCNERTRSILVPLQHKAILASDSPNQFLALDMGCFPHWEVCGESHHHVAVTRLVLGLYDHAFDDKIVDNVQQGEAGAAYLGERRFRLPVPIESHALDDAKGLKTVVDLVGGMWLKSLNHLELQIRKRKRAAVRLSPAWVDALALDRIVRNAWRLKWTGRIACGLGRRRQLRRRGEVAPTFGIEIFPLLRARLMTAKLQTEIVNVGQQAFE
jgi:hypothetical protein